MFLSECLLLIMFNISDWLTYWAGLLLTLICGNDFCLGRTGGRELNGMICRSCSILSLIKVNWVFRIWSEQNGSYQGMFYYPRYTQTQLLMLDNSGYLHWFVKFLIYASVQQNCGYEQILVIETRDIKTERCSLF